MNRIKRLGHEFDENGMKPNEEKVEAILKLKPHERTKIVSRSNPIHGKISTESLGKNRQAPQIIEKERDMEMGN